MIERYNNFDKKNGVVFLLLKKKKDIFLNGRIWSYLFLWRYNQFCRRCTIIFQNVFCIIFSEQCSCCCLFGTILTNDSRVLLAKRGIFSRRQTNVVALFKNKMYMLDEMGGPSNFAIVLEYENQRIFGGFQHTHSVLDKLCPLSSFFWNYKNCRQITI